MLGGLLLREIGKYGQGVPPHRIDERSQLSQALGIQPEIMTGAAPLFLHQTGGFQHLQMLRNSRTADRKPSGEFTYRGGPPAQQMEEGLPGWIGESSQQLSLVGHTLP